MSREGVQPGKAGFARLGVLLPGILVAATGVGAGDLLTAGLAGSDLGTVILWAAIAGALLKWFLNEGIARWQMTTGTTLLEGWTSRLGRWVSRVFFVYLLVWSLFTGGALVSACGVAGAGLWPVGGNFDRAKIIWGVAHSLAGLVLVRAGGFKLFERAMALCIGVMFVTVVLTAVLLRPGWADVAQGFVPSVPKGGSVWVLGVLGGVGGTLTLLSYGYWIDEVGRSGAGGLRACRVDLSVGYTMTALFGVAMIVIGSSVDVARGSGSLSMVALSFADQLGTVLGPAGRWVFLVGFWGAVFSSLLGVWQSVPYIFADFMRLSGGAGEVARGRTGLRDTRAYRWYLVALAVIPLPILGLNLKTAQLLYAAFGALFMPFLALTLLLLNNRSEWVGRSERNGRVTNGVLILTLALFGYVGYTTAAAKLAAFVKAWGG